MTRHARDAILPAGWAETAIEDAFESWGGLTPSKSESAYWKGEIPWASSQEIKSLRVTATTHSVTSRALAETSLRICLPGTVLVVVRSGILAHSLPVAIAAVPLVINQDLKAFDSGDETLNEWLAWWLRSQESEILASNRRDGTTVQSVQYAMLKKRTLPVAPAAEQRRIIDRLQQIDDLDASARRHLERCRAIVDRLREAVLAAACSGRLTADLRPDETSNGKGFPCSWRQTTVGELVESIRGGSTEVPQGEPTRFPILRSSSVRQLAIDYDDIRYLTEEQSQRPENFLSAGDLLVTRLSGSLEYVGNAACVDGRTDPPLQYPDRLFRVRLKEPARAEYVELYFGSPQARAHVAAATRSAAGHQRISISDLKRFEIAMPPADERRELVNRARKLMAAIEGLAARFVSSEDRVDRARRAALAKAFRGELVLAEADVADAERRSYERASELLDRIAGNRPVAVARRRRRVGAV